MKKRPLFHRHEPNCGTIPHLAKLKNPSNKFLHLDPDVYVFQNLTVSSTFKDTSLVKYLWRSVQ